MPNRDALLSVIRIQSEIVQLGLDLDGVMNLVVQRVVELLGADGAAIEMLQGDWLCYRAVAGSVAGRLDTRVRADASLSGQCLREGRPLTSDDTERDDRVDAEACRRIGVRAMVVVPLSFGGTPIGVLKALACRPMRYKVDQVRTLELLAEVVGSALHWAGRYGGSHLYYRATHDELTGLANRSAFLDRLSLSIAQQRRSALPLAVLAIDMDGLKQINDQHGHGVGDAALVEFAKRVRSAARETDTVARLGGDEFAVLLVCAAEPASLQASIQRLQAIVDAPATFDGITVDLRGSIGGAMCPTEGTLTTELLRLADQRMYEAKRARKAQVLH